jgi:hypothetical protein
MYRDHGLYTIWAGYVPQIGRNGSKPNFDPEISGKRNALENEAEIEAVLKRAFGLWKCELDCTGVGFVSVTRFYYIIDDSSYYNNIDSVI